jgi:glycosyltransferase involved in cell wall biosynthesis
MGRAGKVVLMSIVLINSISDTFTPTHSGAIGTWQWEMCRCAAQEGIEPLVISKNADNGVAPYDWPNKVMLAYPFPSSLPGMGRLAETRQKITGWGHVNQHRYNPMVAAAIRSRGAERWPMVLHNDPELTVYLRQQFPDARIISHYYNQNTCSDKFRRLISGSARPSLFTAVSNYTARWTEQYYGLPADSVRTLYNGVDCDRFKPADARPENSVPVINFVGRLSKDKAPDLLLDAALKLAQLGDRFSIQLLGSTFWGGGLSDEYTASLEERAKRLDAAGISVRMPGFINRWDLPSELQKADIHVVPSRWQEPFALSTLEGMAVGLAAVASATGGTPEAVEGAGLLFDKDDLDTLTAHLHLLITDAALRTQYAEAARSRALNFTWSRIWHRLRELAEI